MTRLRENKRQIWVDCIVEDYDTQSRLFTILLDNADGVTLKKRVVRLNLMFAFDNRETFAERHDVAMQCREDFLQR
jgi:hypothetical protein